MFGFFMVVKHVLRKKSHVESSETEVPQGQIRTELFGAGSCWAIHGEADYPAKESGALCRVHF